MNLLQGRSKKKKYGTTRKERDEQRKEREKLIEEGAVEETPKLSKANSLPYQS